MSAGSIDALSVAREFEGTGIERSQVGAIAEAVQSAVAVQRADMLPGAVDSGRGHRGGGGGTSVHV